MSATNFEGAAAVGANLAAGLSQRRLARFAAMEARPIDVEIWPVHAIMWLEPELRPAVPASSGLRIERRHRAPAPDFVRASVVPASGPHDVKEPGAAAPDARRKLPESGLAPMGWDPRAERRPPVLGKEESK